MRDSVVIIGCGMMGSGIGAMSALAGNKTILVDTSLENAEKGKEKAIVCINELLENGLTDQKAADEAINSLLDASDNMTAACDHAFLAVEAIFENLEAKQELFVTLDELLPVEVPILSNTSGLRITDISVRTRHPERTVTAHFWLPAHLVPLVEVVMGDKTDEKVAVYVKDTLTKWKKAPVLVRKDLPGQLANRILQAIIRESINIVAMGLASAEDVDTAIKKGMGIRFPAWGPLEHIDAIGLDLASSVQNTVLPEISTEQTSNAYLVDLIKKGNLGSKTGKGFYDWSQKSIDEAIKGRNEFIIHAVKILNTQK